MSNDSINMNTEELNKNIMNMLQQEHKLYNANTKTHIDYLDLTLHDSIANMNPNKVVTTNGGKLIDEVTEEDHLVSVGDIMQSESE